ncbi:dihydroxyacetone kinase subunit DhaK [Hahella sp. CCB-MM4]|uniref:dihydroxyacetone kinase subunit DhaK n=1 Tax=Hahella sp. (strain CCB-MM4) TaxID=1926491 RepID=UPI000B9BF4F1|nr:dihydroxyacetone kinase subunit DhaK [Hahella sp. CCB-MM4]OZG75446.1 dihydroxyacetone kinase subunit DhaK [Hahella sp. CCB-MM4]
MKKLMNRPQDYVPQSLEGFAAAHEHLVTLNTSPLYLRRASLVEGKVALISGGGSGHEPAHVGFIGPGMLDAACPGEVFTSPVPQQIEEAIKATETGAGSLLIVKNYQGDVMNFEIGAESVETPVATVIVNDDAAGEEPEYARGLAGVLVVEKILGAAAEAGMHLEALKALGDRLVRGISSLGIMLSSCTVPLAGKPTFVLKEDEIEFGVGIHGEHGHSKEPLANADHLIAGMMKLVFSKFIGNGNSRILLFVNGLGGTPESELYIAYHTARKLCEAHGFEVARSLVGNYVTSIDSAGCSITVATLDDELLQYWDAAVSTASLSW